MKRVVIDPTTNTVINVEAIDDSSPVVIDVPAETRVGPGMIWNGKPVAFAFDEPAAIEEVADHG